MSILLCPFDPQTLQLISRPVSRHSPWPSPRTAAAVATGCDAATAAQLSLLLQQFRDCTFAPGFLLEDKVLDLGRTGGVHLFVNLMSACALGNICTVVLVLYFVGSVGRSQVSLRECVIGRGVIIGSRAKLNSVVVMDNVRVGEG